MPETNFFWDPQSDNILQERDETGAVTADYTTEPGLYGNVISQNRDGVESQFHYDALGSTLAVTSDSQQVTDTLAYTAFGKTVEFMGDTELIPFQFIGKKGYYRDSRLGHFVIRRRSYDPFRSRWLSMDPLRAVASAARSSPPFVKLSSPGRVASVFVINWFCYVLNRPQTYADPSGLEHQLITITIFDLTFEVDCETPPPREPGAPLRRCDKRDILPTRVPACVRTLEEALSDDTVTALFSAIDLLRCPKPSVLCACCTEECKGAGAWAFPGTMGMASEIFMCDDQPWHKGNMIPKIRHELTHALQTCRGDPDATCKNRLVRELEAYKAEDRDFPSALRGAVWSACYALRCSKEDINDTLAIELYEWFVGL